MVVNHSQVFVIDDSGKVIQTVLGSDLAAGQKPQHTVPPMVWFGAYPTKDVLLDSEEENNFIRAPVRNSNEHYSLVGCTVAPAFQFEDFEMAKRSQLLELYPHAKHYIELLTHAE
ncbi:hypothetical protein O6H91_06G056800 [Diphasiastrum complanatum]|uniref:Uncharacterized protein n=1 Tax=Diphasiastrum complanatum TaxID=34168 RepID=A0ACC2DE98_DIPCM|nr:hypothetical protein O6H91_06G056800 [Diphasiastrum complanatum]